MNRPGIAGLVIFCAFTLLAAAPADGQDDAARKPFILVTNDDGYESPGIRALAAAMTRLGEVVIVAPKTNQSATSQSLVYQRPILFSRVEDASGAEIWWVDATPASTVRWALDSLLAQRRPDLVVSGVNRGHNLGSAVYYSGTVGAAREAALDGIPAIAASIDSENSDLAGGSELLSRIAGIYLHMDKRPPLLNVNLPGGPITADTKLRITSSLDARFLVKYEERVNPRNTREHYFWVMLTDYTDGGPESDAAALAAGAVSITPLIVDTVSREHLAPLREAVGRKK